MVQPLWKTTWSFLKKLKTELSRDPAIPLLVIPRRNHSSKRYMHPMFTAALFTTAKVWKNPRCPSTEG